MEVIHHFSLLPPIIRYLTLEYLHNKYPENTMIIDKLSLAILKAFDKEHAEYLLTFCNNVSPGFIRGFIVHSCLRDSALTIPTIIIIYGVPVFFSFIYRLIKKKHFAAIKNTETYYFSSSDKIRFYDLNDMIMNSFLSITTLGGYIIIFRIISEYVNAIPVFSDQFIMLKSIFSGILEITSGIPVLLNSNINSYIAYVLILMLTSFGGISGIAQTSGIISRQKLCLKKYILSKIIQSFIAGLLGFVYIIFK